jgi:hypothetical protein
VQSSARYLCSGHSLTAVLVTSKVKRHSARLRSDGFFQYFLLMSPEWGFKTILITVYLKWNEEKVNDITYFITISV